jgi:hypothetical protein
MPSEFQDKTDFFTAIFPSEVLLSTGPCLVLSEHRDQSPRLCCGFGFGSAMWGPAWAMLGLHSHPVAPCEFLGVVW